MALATPEGLVGTVDGTCEGEIAFAPRGDNGFGYDPVFLLSPQGSPQASPQERTMAELEDEEKHAISHRGRAGRAALELIERWLAALPPPP
jgi:XTP/dITP diphosphohydrolase